MRVSGSVRERSCGAPPCPSRCPKKVKPQERNLEQGRPASGMRLGCDLSNRSVSGLWYALRSARLAVVEPLPFIANYLFANFSPWVPGCPEEGSRFPKVLVVACMQVRHETLVRTETK